jgi:hypothetical protein
MGNPQANSQKRISNYPSAAFSSATRDKSGRNVRPFGNSKKRRPPQGGLRTFLHEMAFGAQ